MKKIIIIIIILIAGGFFAVSNYKANNTINPFMEETMEESMVDDTSEAAIGEELDNIDVGGDDSQFNDVEADLQNL